MVWCKENYEQLQTYPELVCLVSCLVYVSKLSTANNSPTAGIPHHLVTMIDGASGDSHGNPDETMTCTAERKENQGMR